MASNPGDPQMCIGKPTGSVAICCLLVATAASLPAVQGADKPANANPVNARTPQPKTFALTVAGPDGKAIPEIAVEIRGEPPVTAEQIREGRFLRQAKDGSFVRSTARGRIVLDLPANLTRFDVLIETPRYAPYWARWDSEDDPEPLPSTFTAELDAAWCVGGIIVDGNGKPVEGARITPRIHYKYRPDDFEAPSYFGRHATTDAAGRWRFDSVPVSQADVVVTIDHADFAPQENLATRWEFGLDDGRNPNASITLERGLTVVGKVTDEAGKPIAGVLVRTWFRNTIRKALTGPDGFYRLRGCERAPARIVVSAKGRAMDMHEVQVAPGMGPVNFQMKPGGRVRVRVLDEHDKPIPKFHLLFQRWLNGTAVFEFDEVNPVADDRGVWEWRNATLDVFAADIICPGHETLPRQLVARRDEYVFRAEPALSVSGRVVDRETKRPITRFLVESGFRVSRSDRDWKDATTVATADGRYRLQTAEGNPNRLYVIGIEADGYGPAVSRGVRGYERSVTFDFELTRSQDFEATVLTPEGRPAVHAKVVGGEGWQSLDSTNGDVNGQPWKCRETDADGRVHFPPQDPEFFIFITHPSGYATYRPKSKSNHRIIVLDPWTRVEGTYRIGGKPLAGVPIVIRHDNEAFPQSGEPRVVENQRTITGPEGRFVFERVMAGRGTLARYVVPNTSGWINSTSALQARFPLGKTVHVDLEETGRPVIGSLRPPAGVKQKVDWRSAVVELVLQTSGAPSRSHFPAAVSADGTFRTGPLPGGMYSLDVRFRKAGPGHVWDRPVIVSTNDSDKDATQPLDLGVLTLDKN